MDYCGICRSNYFKVKDLASFKQFCKRFYLKQVVGGPNNELVGFLNEDGGIPSAENPEPGEWESVKFFQELATHLVDDHVAIVMETGSEGMRYLIGVACAVNSKGELAQVDLDEIYERAKPLGTSITACASIAGL